MERVKEVWDKGYRYCELSDHVIMRTAPLEECKQRGDESFDVIDNKCVLWKKEQLFLIDPWYMRKVSDVAPEDAEEPLCGKLVFNISVMHQM